MNDDRISKPPRATLIHDNKDQGEPLSTARLSRTKYSSDTRRELSLNKNVTNHAPSGAVLDKNKLKQIGLSLGAPMVRTVETIGQTPRKIKITLFPIANNKTNEILGYISKHKTSKATKLHFHTSLRNKDEGEIDITKTPFIQLKEFKAIQDRITAAKKNDQTKPGQVSKSLTGICKPDPELKKYPKKGVILHDTEEGTHLGTLIQLTHTKRGSLGYHYVIDKSGKISQYVPPTEGTNHAYKANRGTIGVAFLGEGANEMQKKAFLKLMVTLQKKHVFGTDKPFISGHVDVGLNEKTDPSGVDVKSVVQQINKAGGLFSFRGLAAWKKSFQR